MIKSWFNPADILSFRTKVNSRALVFPEFPNLWPTLEGIPDFGKQNLLSHFFTQYEAKIRLPSHAGNSKRSFSYIRLMHYRLRRSFGVLKHKKSDLAHFNPHNQENGITWVFMSPLQCPPPIHFSFQPFFKFSSCLTEMSSSFSEKTDFCRLPTAITFPSEALVKYLKEYICFRKMSYLDYVRQGLKGLIILL